MTDQPPTIEETGEGGPSTEAGSLDVADGRDRRLIDAALRRRWAIPADLREMAVQAAKVALGKAVQDKNVRGINGTLRTLQGFEKQNQDDEHVIVKYKRIDEGRPTEVVKEIGVDLRRFKDGDQPPEEADP